jgi:hypothetical protein
VSALCTASGCLRSGLFPLYFALRSLYPTSGRNPGRYAHGEIAAARRGGAPGRRRPSSRTKPYDIMIV